MLSYSKITTVEQVDYDLKGMLENKVEAQNLEIRKISPFSENGQELYSVYFDCELCLPMICFQKISNSTKE
ncbi:hypothetical protein DRF60_00040 [Chryseobacterium elymi]|uniref:Uncharacterized protein n=1 Tax=Chryseobacterium elymi TaxID=395936 RepID=A0A3D9DQH6_9FLAO|nr:hypothetical protein [Chryseobacterium elymi]REC80146.1 hypothetical protein DRF60_00040 [Chryseobacterium elymi]